MYGIRRPVLNFRLGSVDTYRLNVLTELDEAWDFYRPAILVTDQKDHCQCMYLTLVVGSSDLTGGPFGRASPEMSEVGIDVDIGRICMGKRTSISTIVSALSLTFQVHGSPNNPARK